jgi:phosphate transport system substrate-binding protein
VEIKHLRRRILGAVALVSLLPLLGSPMASAATKTELHWAGCGITKKSFMAELAAAYEKKTGIHIDIQGGGATRGIRDTAKGLVDMGGSCRMALPDEDDSEMRVEMHPVAWDALAVIVHKSNGVSNVTSDQVRDIYLGKITSWKSLGATDAPLHLYVRAGKVSGVGYALRQYFFKDGSIDFVTDPKRVVPSSGPLEQAVEKDPYAIGMTGVSSARKRDVKILAVDGVEPTYNNVKDGKYGFYRPLYLVTASGASKDVRDFVKFAQSEDGRQVLRAQGTVPYRDALHLMKKMAIYGFGMK